MRMTEWHKIENTFVYVFVCLTMSVCNDLFTTCLLPYIPNNNCVNIGLYISLKGKLDLFSLVFNKRMFFREKGDFMVLSMIVHCCHKATINYPHLFSFFIKFKIIKTNLNLFTMFT